MYGTCTPLTIFYSYKNIPIGITLETSSLRVLGVCPSKFYFFFSKRLRIFASFTSKIREKRGQTPPTPLGSNKRNLWVIPPPPTLYHFTTFSKLRRPQFKEWEKDNIRFKIDFEFNYYWIGSFSANSKKRKIGFCSTKWWKCDWLFFYF